MGRWRPQVSSHPCYSPQSQTLPLLGTAPDRRSQYREEVGNHSSSLIQDDNESDWGVCEECGHCSLTTVDDESDPGWGSIYSVGTLPLQRSCKCRWCSCSRSSSHSQHPPSGRSSDLSSSRPRLACLPDQLSSLYTSSRPRSPSPERHLLQSKVEVLEKWTRGSSGTLLAGSGWVNADRPAECFIQEGTNKPYYSLANVNHHRRGQEVRGLHERQAWRVGICYNPWRPIKCRSNTRLAHWGVYIRPVHSREVCFLPILHLLKGY